MQVAKKLLGISGILNDKSLLFMIDSGATNNFLSLATVRSIGLTVHRESSVKYVRLANGLRVEVCGVASTLVQLQQL